MLDKKDLIIIGAGPGGYVAAIRAGQLGKSVALVESDQVGGICLNKGCIPSKALLSVTRLLARARQASKYGVDLDITGVDTGRLDRWKNDVVQRLRSGLQYLLSANKVELVSGRAQFVNAGTVSVKLAGGEEKLLEAENVIIASGSSPRGFERLAFDGKRILSPEQVMSDISCAPSRFAILGGGVIAVELANICQSLGSKVAIVVRSEILRRFDKDIKQICTSSLRRIGVDILPGSSVAAIDESNGSFKLKINKENQSTTLEVDKLIVATGRTPNTHKLGLKETGVNPDEQGFIIVNERRETGVPGIFAIGDVTGEPLLAHKASAEGKYAAELIAGIESHPPSRFIPNMVFSACEAASVGLTEDEARAKGEIKTGYFPVAALGCAHANDSTAGFVKIIAEPSSDKILGVHIAGDSAAELIGEAALAMEMGVKVREFAEVIHPHPTMSEALGEAALDVYSQAIHFFRPPGRGR